MSKAEDKVFFDNLNKLMREYIVPAMKSELVEYYRRIDAKMRGIDDLDKGLMGMRVRVEKVESEIYELKWGMGKAIGELLLREEKDGKA